jgi:ubiquinone/menaquinone biosynthesis C-methylase UbiE
MDFVILSNVLFHLEDKQGCAKEVVRVLKDGGRVLIVDWSESFGGMGPVPTQVVPADRAAAFFTSLGLTVLTTTLPAGDHHYAILLKK